MNKLLIPFLLVLFTYSTASADLLCIKKSNVVKNNRVKLRNALLVNATSCPTGYLQLLTTDTFQGTAGTNGASGPVGAQGPQGNPGTDGTFATSLQSGQQIVGYFSCAGTASGVEDLAHSPTSFITQLASAPTVEKVVGDASTANCPGTAANPVSSPGYLCLYQGVNINISQWHATNHETFDTNATTEGFAIFCRSTGVGDFYLQGSWAYMAPIVF